MIRAVLVAALLLVACDDPAVCGDGRAEGGEQCDDANQRDDDACSNTCRVQPTLDAQVIWKLLSEELPGFAESCPGVEAVTARIELSGPESRVEEVSCNFMQKQFQVLSPGDYTVKGTLYDAAGVALTRGLATTTFTIGSSDVQASIDFAMDDFVRTDYVGDWLFKLTWAGALTCAAAMPPVTEATIRLERDGEVLVEGDGAPIDGALAFPCKDSIDTAEAYKSVPWGPATATVTGLDQAGEIQFRETFATFVGAGASNDVFVLDVDSVLPDAGGGEPDAGPDGDLPDAGAADAAP